MTPVDRTWPITRFVGWDARFIQVGRPEQSGERDKFFEPEPVRDWHFTDSDQALVAPR